MGLWAECVEWVWRPCLVRTQQEGSGVQQRDQRKPGGMPALCGIEVANRATVHGASPPEAKMHCMEILSMHMEPLHWFTHSLTHCLPAFLPQGEGKDSMDEPSLQPEITIQASATCCHHCCG